MPSLLEVQCAMGRQLLGEAAIRAAQPPAAPFLALDPQCLAIYRHTCQSTLINALRLSFPAVERLVGAEFFGGAAYRFIEQCVPASAYLDEYGEHFVTFLRAMPQAQSVIYLGDVAELEWAVNRALHAPEVSPLHLQRLSAVAPEDLPRVVLKPVPALSLLRLRYPADRIWTAVLSADDTAMAAIDLKEGPVHLLVERGDDGLHMERQHPILWQLTHALCAGLPWREAIRAAADLSNRSSLSTTELTSLLAQTLSAGRFMDFQLPDPSTGDHDEH